MVSKSVFVYVLLGRVFVFALLKIFYLLYVCACTRAYVIVSVSEDNIQELALLAEVWSLVSATLRFPG